MAQLVTPFDRVSRVSVLGAGTMGAGIAAHLANLGFQVSIHDISRERAAEGLERARSTSPPSFMTQDRFASVEPASISDIDLIREADWVCEAVAEKFDIKRALLETIEPLVRSDAYISTNTSGLPIGQLAEGRSDSFRRRFLGAHFFNPPRYLKLLELIPTSDTDPDVAASMTRLMEDRLGRRVVVAKDTPGFIANRFGMWSMFCAIHAAEKLHLTIEEVDAITGPFLGRPKSATFRLNDIVGLDVMADIARSLQERCPNDPAMANFNLPKSMTDLIARGWIGDKAGQGYYRKEAKELFALDLTTGAYRMLLEPRFDSLAELNRLPLTERLPKALELRDEAGEFLRLHLLPVLKYANAVKEEISHSVLDFDRVMRWGFGWEMGPFEMIDAVGPHAIGITEGTFYSSAGYRSFAGDTHPYPKEPAYAKLTDYPLIHEEETLTLRDMGDGVTVASLKTKLGVISPDVVRDLRKLILEAGQKRFVLHSEARSFSAGYDLTYFNEAIGRGDYDAVLSALINLQSLGELLEKTNVVAAVYGHCLGAGLEMALSCPVIVADSETKIGLPESRVGLIPGGRGCVLMRSSNSQSARRLADAALMVAEGRITNSALEAVSVGYLRMSDQIVQHPDHLLPKAKELALKAAPAGPISWPPAGGPLTGMIDQGLAERRRKGEFSDYDVTIGEKIKTVFAKTTSYEEAMRREQEEFIDLCKRNFTQVRIRHMLENGRPLKN